MSCASCSALGAETKENEKESKKYTKISDENKKLEAQNTDKHYDNKQGKLPGVEDHCFDGCAPPPAPDVALSGGAWTSGIVGSRCATAI